MAEVGFHTIRRTRQMKNRISLEILSIIQLLDLNENRVHEHPFMNVISKEIGIYFGQAEKDKLDWFMKLKNQIIQPQELYKELLGDASSWFLS